MTPLSWDCVEPFLTLGPGDLRTAESSDIGPPLTWSTGFKPCSIGYELIILETLTLWHSNNNNIPQKLEKKPLVRLGHWVPASAWQLCPTLIPTIASHTMASSRIGHFPIWSIIPGHKCLNEWTTKCCSLFGVVPSSDVFVGGWLSQKALGTWHWHGSCCYGDPRTMEKQLPAWAWLLGQTCLGQVQGLLFTECEILDNPTHLLSL